MDDGHKEACNRSSGECEDVRKEALEAYMGHQTAAEEWQDAHHKYHHKDGVEVGSHQSEYAGASDVQIHHGHKSPGAEEREIAHDSDRVG